MTNKKLLIATLMFFSLFLIILVLSLLKTGQKPQPTQPLPTPTIVPVKITVSGISVNNFLKNPEEVNAQGDALFVKKEDYQLVYLPAFDQFLITILSPSFEDVKREAEDEFIKTLDISPNDACKLNVAISTPSFINPEMAGKKYPLSFCEEQ